MGYGVPVLPTLVFSWNRSNRKIIKFSHCECATCILLAEKAGRVMGLQGLQRPLNQRMPHIGDGAIYGIPKHLGNAVHTVEISGFSWHSDFTWNQFLCFQKFKTYHLICIFRGLIFTSFKMSEALKLQNNGTFWTSKILEIDFT